MSVIAFTPAELAEMFAKIEREVASAAGSGEVLDMLTHAATAMVPGAKYAGISMGRGSKFVTVAATDEVVHEVDAIQYQQGSGPCVDAIVEDTVFNAGDLSVDSRWPHFGREAAEKTGIVSMLSFRLYMETDAELVAGLNLYSSERGAFDEASEIVGTLLATYGALAVANATAREKAGNLTVALQSSREIGIAMGVLMNRYRVTREQAFDLLRIASQNTHRKLAVIASHVADTGELPTPSQHSQRERPQG